MKVSEATLNTARSLKNPAVEELLKFYNFVTSNQVYESFVARVITLEKWNGELIENPVSILSAKAGEEANKDKEVDRILKFMEKQPDLIQGTEELRSKLTGSDNDKLKTDKRIKIEDIAL